MALLKRTTSRSTWLMNPIISTVRRQISTDTTTIKVESCESRTLHSSSSLRRPQIPANSLYNHYGIGTRLANDKRGGDNVPGLKVAGQHFMHIKPDTMHLASPLSVVMNYRQSMLKSTRAHFSSSAESQKAPLHNDQAIQNGNKHLRPLSPHLSVYKPQSSSMFSIFNRMSAAMLTVIVLSSTLLTMKMGYICLSYAYFYQMFFYLSKLIPLSVEIGSLALAYHIFHSGYLFLRRLK